MRAMLRITSEVFKNNGHIPPKYTFDGANVNPPLIIGGLPMKTKTLVLIVDDPDAHDKAHIHWMIWNIPATNKIQENTIPGEEGFNDFKKQHYRGCYRPSSLHRYFFRIYALSDYLSLSPKTNRTELEAAMERCIVGYGETVGVYERKK